ncbi:thioredoxin family protein [Chitinophaga sp. Hz27]|uniref:thioredoxin family protein n=1 Tax=Chitinophaga sp. Hz27 TaxID=3347169 RepID=UPI0035DC6884
MPLGRLDYKQSYKTIKTILSPINLNQLQMVVEVSQSNWDEELENIDTPFLISFWAGWCGPCQALNPVIEDLSEIFAHKIKVCRLNADHDPALCDAFGVKKIPALLFVVDKKIVAQYEGFVSKEELEDEIRQYV